MQKDLRSALLEQNEIWVSETEPFFIRDDKYYFFEREGWSEAGPFASLEECRLSFEAYLDTSEYI